MCKPTEPLMLSREPLKMYPVKVEGEDILVEL